MNLAELAPRIRQILQMSDLSTVSAKKVRRQLENDMGTTLDGYKADIDEIIKQQFQVLHSESQQRQHAQQQYVSQYSAQAPLGVYGAAQIGLQPQQPFAGALPPMPAPPAPDQPRKRGRPRKLESEKKLQRKKKRDEDPNRPKRQTGLSKPMKLSPELRDFLDQKYCARTDVVKNLWKYIKQHELQDAADKRYILCDDKLQTLFHTERLYMYTMNKLLNDHLIKPTPEENAEAIQLLDLPPTHPAAADSRPKPEPAQAESPAHAESPAPAESPVPAESPAPTESPAAQSDDATDPKPEPKSEPATSPLALPPMPSGVNGGSN
ncbi:hypothetical protein H4S01_005598 [Coemansia sp. RSA 2610]|nr:hypothetical protein H4S01_005598 [Coemansia sp. RSA 2610]